MSRRMDAKHGGVTSRDATARSRDDQPRRLDEERQGVAWLRIEELVWNRIRWDSLMKDIPCKCGSETEGHEAQTFWSFEDEACVL